MELKYIMGLLAEHHTIGVISITSIMWALSLIISLEVVIFRRRNDIKLSSMCFIPVLNIVYLLTGILKVKKLKKSEEVFEI